MDWLEKIVCLKCNEDGNLLVCSENGCPIAIHEGCMRCPARFNDAGEYCCPYCVYKHANADLRQAREFALARRKDLLIFLDKRMMGGENHLEENIYAEANGHTELKVGGDVNIRRFDDDKSVNRDEERKISDAEEDKSQASASSEGQEPSLKMHEKQKIINEEEKEEEEDGEDEGNIQEEENIDEEKEENIQDEEEEDNWEEEIDNFKEDEDDTSAASRSQGHSPKMHEHEICNREEDKIQEKECETSSASTGQYQALTPSGRANRGSKKRKPIDSDSDLVPKQNKRVRGDNEKKQASRALNFSRRSRRSSSARRTEKVLDEKGDTSRNSEQPQQPSFNLHGIPSSADDILGHGKRKRLLWREEEEEKLKEGVQMYSSKGCGKLPWKEILELGRKVFDRTRTPSDLRDKWRSMLRKDKKSRT